jgi:chloramphenicol 3-O-phosphotransferase
MMTATTGSKLCVKCRKDVSHGSRMKDGNGAYWCVDCGSADSRTKHSTRMVCVDCRALVSPSHVLMVGVECLCEGCAAGRRVRGAVMLGALFVMGKL